MSHYMSLTEAQYQAVLAALDYVAEDFPERARYEEDAGEPETAANLRRGGEIAAKVSKDLQGPECAYEGARWRLDDGRCAACGRTPDEAQADADALVVEHSCNGVNPTPVSECAGCAAEARST